MDTMQYGIWFWLLVAFLVLTLLILVYQLYKVRRNIVCTQRKNGNSLPTAAMADEKNTFFVDMDKQGMFGTATQK
jgi:heme exporter protein D